MMSQAANASANKKVPLGKLTFKRTHHRELSVNIRPSSTYRDSSHELSSDSIIKTPVSFINSKVPVKNSKFLVSKQIESTLKETLQQLNTKKIKVIVNQSIKREKESADSEKLFTSFLMIFGEIDPTINTRGLKVNPYEVMMNYISMPSKVEKTLEKTEFCLKNNRITDKVLLQAHSYFCNIQPDNLTTSKVLYSLLGIIFKYFGITDKKTQEVLQPSNSLNLAKSALQIIQTPSATSKCLVNDENFMFKTAENEKPENKFSDVTFLLETVSRPPRISQKYLDSMLSKNNRSLSAAYLVVHPQIVS